MRKALISLALLAALTVSCQASDSRLAQRITYQGGYKRLHSVAEDLTKQTGVTIRAGDNKQDWHVRDIPLVVFVKDMPLGKLLQTIADCAHVTFAREKIANAKNDNPVYKLYRTRKQREAIDSVLTARAEANRKLAEWSWDTLVAYSDMPDASADIPIKGDSFDAGQIRAVARMLQSLGPEAKERALSGERIVESMGKDAKAPLREMCEYAGTHHCNNAFPTIGGNEAPTVLLDMHPSESLTGLSVFLYNVPDRTGTMPKGSVNAWRIQPSSLARAVASVEKLNLPKEPDTKSAFADDDPFPQPGFATMATEDDWKNPLLQDKVKMPRSDLREGKRVPSDLVDMAKQSGINVICEDFVSQWSADDWWGDSPLLHISKTGVVSEEVAPVKAYSVVEMTTAQALQSTRNHKFRMPRWFFNKDSNLIVGWASDWRVTHLSLIPESMQVSIIRKMQTDGAELDDLIPFAYLEPRQLEMWFPPKHVPTAMLILRYGIAFSAWNLYYSLDPEQKKQARSGAGLPLTLFDSGWLRDYLGSVRDKYSKYDAWANTAGDLSAMNRLLGSAELVGTTRLRIASEPSQYPDTIPKHTYFALIESVSAARTETLVREELSINFPFYTRAREAELRKKAEVNAAEKK